MIMDDFMKGVDNRIEHQFHNGYNMKCSECFLERGRVSERRDDLRESLGTPIRQGEVEDFIRNPNPLE